MQIYPNHESTSQKRKRKLPFFFQTIKTVHLCRSTLARAETRFEIRNLNKDAC